MIGYDQFLANLRTQWQQGDHLTLVGPTKVGKTWLAAELLPMRGYSVIVTTKKRDDTLTRYVKYRRIKKWANYIGEKRLMLRPISKELVSSAYTARIEIARLLQDAYISGGWTIYIDDMFFVAKTLKLANLIQMMYTQARSNKVTLVASIQRPSWVPIEVLSQSTHVILFHVNDELDLDRVSQATGMNRKEIREANKHIKKYDFLYIENGRNFTHVTKGER